MNVKYASGSRGDAYKVFENVPRDAIDTDQRENLPQRLLISFMPAQQKIRKIVQYGQMYRLYDVIKFLLDS